MTTSGKLIKPSNLLSEKRLVSLLFIFICLVHTGFGQENFYFKYDIQTAKEVKIADFSNGDLLVVGEKPNAPTGKSVYFFSRSNRQGKLIWRRSLAFNGINFGPPELLITESDHIVFATKKSVTKITPKGDIKWSRNYIVQAETAPNTVYQLMEGPQNNIFLYGYFPSWASPKHELLIKIDQNGNPLLVKRFSGKHTFANATMTSNGNIMTTRTITDPDSAITVTKLRPNGEVIWDKKIRPDLRYTLDLLTEDGQIIIALTSKQKAKLRLLKISGNGQNIIWQQDKVLSRQGFSNTYNFRDMDKGPGDHLWVNGYTEPFDFYSKTFPLLLKVEENGQ